MNEAELITLIREQRARVTMTVPLAGIISRGRSVRSRRRISRLASALAVAAGTSLAVAAVVSSGHQPAVRPATQLAAWTVTRQADGDVDVTVSQLRDPAGLARALHADGVPAYVDFAGHASVFPGTNCARYRGFRLSKAQLQAIYKFHQGDGSVALTIDPSAMPSGAWLFIFDIAANPAFTQAGRFAVVGGRAVGIHVVHAREQCVVASQPS